MYAIGRDNGIGKFGEANIRKSHKTEINKIHMMPAEIKIEFEVPFFIHMLDDADAGHVIPVFKAFVRTCKTSGEVVHNIPGHICKRYAHQGLNLCL